MKEIYGRHRFGMALWCRFSDIINTLAQLRLCGAIAHEPNDGKPLPQPRDFKIRK
jgi:hypothetical protein